MSLDWYENEDLFRKEVGEGHLWERYVGMFLRLQGLEVELTEQEIRDHLHNRHKHEGSIDMRVNRVQVECKSRKVAFTSPLDFPYQDIFVDTVRGWDTKEPAYTICVSRHTGAMIAISATTKEHWMVKATHDRTRDMDQSFYEAPKHLWLPVNKLVDRLRSGDHAFESWRTDCLNYHQRSGLGAVSDPSVDELLGELV